MLIDFVFITRCISKCLSTLPHKLETICNCQCLTEELSHKVINCLVITDIYMSGSYTRKLRLHKSYVHQLLIFCIQHIGEYLVQIVSLYVLYSPS